jgi:acid phosphatase
MKKIIFALVSTLLFSTTLYAVEPENLSTAKKNILQYHDSGEYDNDITQVSNAALQYLKQRIAANQNRKLAIILDIDETSLSNYNDIRAADFGGSIEQIQLSEDKGTDPAINQTLKIFQFAKANHVAVFFLTGRHEQEREATAHNLQTAGYKDWDGLILRDGEYTKAPASTYKIAMRKKLVSEGYDIVLNIGDQESDLRGGYADKTFKLPNPYYNIP